MGHQGRPRTHAGDQGALLAGIQGALICFEPLAWSVGGDGKGCVQAGRRSGCKGDEAVSWRDIQGGRLSLNNILSREIFNFSNFISHRTGCIGIHAGWERGRGAVIVLHWTDVYCPLAVVLQHPRSCRLSGGCGAEMLLLRKQRGTSIRYCFLELKEFLPNEKSLLLYKKVLHL